MRPLTDSSGTFVASYACDAFRNPTHVADTVGNPLRYTGSPFDTATGLIDDRARFYDPSTGRFLTPDPMGGGYAYAGDNPVNRVDPSGKAWVNPGAIIEGGNGGYGCTMQMYLQGQCGVRPSGSGSSDGDHFSWARCGTQLAVYVLTMFALIIGWDVEPGSQLLMNGAVTLSTTFTSFAPDMVEMAQTRNDPLRYGIAAVQLFADAMFFIWDAIVYPNLDFWSGLLIGANFAADIIPGALPVRVGLAIAGAAIGAYAIYADNCWPGM